MQNTEHGTQNAEHGTQNFKLQTIMYLALLIMGLGIFGYLMYVLIKPEKF
jgi:K+-transporting ATPase KdpF subunit